MSKTLREQLLPFATGTQRACARKSRYDSKASADRMLGVRMRHETEQLYSYQCPHCDGWHLTKLRQPQ